MYGIFTNICPKNDPNVGKYSIHGASGILMNMFRWVYKPTSTVLGPHPVGK